MCLSMFFFKFRPDVFPNDNLGRLNGATSYVWEALGPGGYEPQLFSSFHVFLTFKDPRNIFRKIIVITKIWIFVHFITLLLSFGFQGKKRHKIAKKQLKEGPKRSKPTTIRDTKHYEIPYPRFCGPHAYPISQILWAPCISHIPDFVGPMHIPYPRFCGPHAYPISQISHSIFRFPDFSRW